MTKNEMMDYMSKNLGNQDDPYVGIFWYDPSARELFGIDKVHSLEKDFNTNGAKTTNTLHRDFWQKQHHKDKALNRQSRFIGDYSMTPRGRVWQERNKGFFVTVGEWINQHPEAKKLILLEFDLPKDTKFIIDPHWNIGSGWSGDLLR